MDKNTFVWCEIVFNFLMLCATGWNLVRTKRGLREVDKLIADLVATNFEAAKRLSELANMSSPEEFLKSLNLEKPNG